MQKKAIMIVWDTRCIIVFRWTAMQITMRSKEVEQVYTIYNYSITIQTSIPTGIYRYYYYRPVK